MADEEHLLKVLHWGSLAEAAPELRIKQLDIPWCSAWGDALRVVCLPDALVWTHELIAKVIICNLVVRRKCPIWAGG